jgi:hypothetical protein
MRYWWVNQNLEVPSAAAGSGREHIVRAVEDGIESTIAANPELRATEKEHLIKARRGQGLFRENVLAFEKQCRISGVMDLQFVIASHIKPWRVATNEERLDGENGLLLSPNHDLLFDRGFISFDDDGALLISPIADKECLHRMGIPIDIAVNVGEFQQNNENTWRFIVATCSLKPGKKTEYTQSRYIPSEIRTMPRSDRSPSARAWSRQAPARVLAPC